MARSKGTWGTVREVPRKGSGRFQASYVHGGVRGIQPGARYTAPQTFDTRGDAWAWLDRERRLIDKDDWTPPRERLRAAEEVSPDVSPPDGRGVPAWVSVKDASRREPVALGTRQEGGRAKDWARWVDS